MLTWCRLLVLERNISASCRFYMQHEEKVHITMPVRLSKKILKVKQKSLIANEKKSALLPRNKGRLIVSCKRPEYNFYMGQPFNKMKPNSLASHSWQGRKTAGDHLTLMPHRQNPALLKDETTNFDDFDLRKDLQERLQELELINPTNIQRLAIPRLLEGKNLICAAETGSGKTFAYLVPLVNNILEANDKFGMADVPLNAPRCIVALPTRELVTQIGRVCSELTSSLPVTTRAVCGGGESSEQSRVKGPIDVLVTTPQILKSMLSTKYLKSSRLLSLVLDEADSLMDDSFNHLFRQILFQLQATPSLDPGTGIQMALISATMPRNLKECLGNLVSLDDFQEVRTNHLHHIMSHVKQTFLKIKTSDKLQETVKIIKKLEKASEPIIIFCNKNDTCYYLSKSLEEVGIENVIFTSKVDDSDRDASFQRFQDGECDVMVCSDVASRGLNTVRAKHVLNYDFPHFISDYIHRAGRVGRVGSGDQCQVTCFVTHKWDVELLWNIEMSARASSELHNVNANIKRKLVRRHGNPYLD